MASALLLSAGNVGAQKAAPQSPPAISEKSKGESANSHTVAKKQPTQATPSVVTPTKPSQSAPKDNQNQTQESWWWPPLPSSWVLIGITSAYVVISFFTLGVIKKQGDRIAKLDAPFLSLDFKFVTLPSTGIPTGEWCIIDYWFINNGRSPATISNMSTTFCLDNKLPIQPEYEDQRPRKIASYPADVIVIAPNGGSTKPRKLGTRFHPIDAPAINLKQKWWFLYGFVQYKDAASNERVLGFGYEFDTTFGGLSMIDSSAYNYHRISGT